MPLADFVNGTLRGRRKTRERRAQQTRSPQPTKKNDQQRYCGSPKPRRRSKRIQKFDSGDTQSSRSLSPSFHPLTTEETRSADPSLSYNAPGSSQRRVSFTSVEVREYGVTLDPNYDSPYALTLGWQHGDAYEANMNDGEGRRSSGARRMDEMERRERLEELLGGHGSLATFMDAMLRGESRTCIDNRE